MQAAPKKRYKRQWKPCHCSREECRGKLRDPRTVANHAKNAVESDEDQDANAEPEQNEQEHVPEPDHVDDDISQAISALMSEYQRSPAEDVEHWDDPIVVDNTYVEHVELY
jgi:hypothetical protein